jgi:hypothetical protein
MLKYDFKLAPEWSKVMGPEHEAIQMTHTNAKVLLRRRKEEIDLDRVSGLME